MVRFLASEHNPISANIRSEQARTGTTRAQLSQATGITERQITRWRAGVQPRHESVIRLAEFFGRPVEWFYADHNHSGRNA